MKNSSLLVIYYSTKKRTISDISQTMFKAAETVPVTRLSSDLEALLSNIHYWLELVERLGYDRAVYEADADPTLDTLSRYFDSSHRGLLRVFNLFDRDHDSTVTYEEIGTGLRQQGLFSNGNSPEAIAAFQELWRLVENNGAVRPPEFLWALKTLRLAAVMSSYMRPKSLSQNQEEMRLFYHEYREDKLSNRMPIEAPVSFLFQTTTVSSPEEMRVRWLHCHDPPRGAVLGLGMKYGIDPRFMLDIFGLWREPARADVVTPPISSMTITHAEETQIFIVVPVLRLTRRSEESCEPYEAWRRLKRSGLGRHTPPPCVIAEVEHCNLAILLVGEGSNTNVLSFTSEWGRLSKLITHDAKEVVPLPRRQISSSDPKEPLLQSDFATALQSKQLSFEKPVEHHDDMSAFRKILSTLNTSYSHLRTGDAQTFLLKTLCEVTEDYLSIMKAYDYGLNVLQKRLDRQRDNMSQRDVRKIRKSVRQLSHLYRLVSPVLAVSDSLAKMKWSGDASLYLSDIKGNVSRFLDDAIAHREFSRGMIDQFQNFCESKTSQILYLLTRVTTLFVPGQFLASVYGMNFVDSSGSPTIPELNWEYGYAYYWGMVVTLTSIIFSVIFYVTKRN